MDNREYKKISLYWMRVFAILMFLSVFATFSNITTVKANPTTKDEALIVLENSTGTRWTQHTQLNVFANVKYDGQNMIAPMSKGEYKFTVKNSASFPLKYIMRISDENVDGIPMDFRLKQAEKYLVGNENEWGDISKISEVTNVLAENTEEEYYLEWRWLGNNDELDTMLGVKAQDGEVKYLLDFEISAELDEEPTKPNVPAEQDEEPIKPNAPEDSPQTGDTSNVLQWFVLVIFSGMLFVVLGLRKQRKANESK